MSGNGPKTNEQPVDRRVRRTRDLLRRALLELILERGYDRISVRDILDRADVGRSTFYAHYRDKEDLLEAGFEDVRWAIASEQEARDADGAKRTRFLQPLLAAFRHVEAHRHYWHALSRKGGADVIARFLRRSVDDLVREELRARFPEAANDPARSEAAIRFVGGACMGLLLWWLDTQAPVSAEELFTDFERLASHGVRPFLKG